MNPHADAETQPASGARHMNWRRRWRQRLRGWRLRPAVAGAVILGVFILGVSIVGDIHQHAANARALAALQRIPVATVHQLVTDLKAGTLRSLVRERVDTGGWLSVRDAYWVVATTTTGQQFRVQDIPVVSEGFWKQVLAGVAAHPVRMQAGFGVDVGRSRLAGFTALAILGLFFVVILLAAQRLVQEVLVGGGVRPAKVAPHINLDAVIGHKEIKDDLRALARWMNHPSEAARRGVALPRGILFTGPPGVGKTLLASALSNEIHAAFFEASGSDFVQLYAGSGPHRVRQLFRRARMERGAVIFIDEVDALGSRDHMGHDTEGRRTLNEILVQMDGFPAARRLLVIAATNRPDDLDPALRRPGRFTQIMHMEAPDPADRVAILNYYLTGVARDADVDVQALARRAFSGTGDTLRAWIEEARRLAARRTPLDTEICLSMADFMQAEERALLGIARTHAVTEDLERTAIHELGHALVGHLLRPRHRIERVTVMGRGGALGYTTALPRDEGMLATVGECKALLAFMMGGRASEQGLLGEASTGAGDDLARASELARRMVTEWGMADGMLASSTAWRLHPTTPLPAAVLAHINHLLDEATRTAAGVIQDHLDWMHSWARRLAETGALGHDDLFAPDGALRATPPEGPA